MPETRVCFKKYNKEICENCQLMNTEMVSHPGGESTASVEKNSCDEGYWEEDF